MNKSELQRLAGIKSANHHVESKEDNMTVTAQEKADYQRKHNIKPGDPEWFKLWFSQPQLTGENPTPKD